MRATSWRCVVEAFRLQPASSGVAELSSEMKRRAAACGHQQGQPSSSPSFAGSAFGSKAWRAMVPHRHEAGPRVGVVARPPAARVTQCRNGGCRKSARETPRPCGAPKIVLISSIRPAPRHWFAGRRAATPRQGARRRRRRLRPGRCRCPGGDDRAVALAPALPIRSFIAATVAALGLCSSEQLRYR